MLKVLIADDHAIVRRGLKQILEETSEMGVFEASSGEEALDMVQMNEWDVIVLDLKMQGLSGLDVLKKLRSSYTNLPVLILTMYSEDQLAMRLLRAGASGYLTKENAPDELVNAIKKVVAGGRYVSPSFVEKLVSDLGTEYGKPPHEYLSSREYEVMCLIASGKTVKEIAAKLYLRAKTIGTYRTRVLKKMNMKTDVELTHYATINSLISSFQCEE